jgi:hypothetical protein
MKTPYLDYNVLILINLPEHAARLVISNTVSTTRYEDRVQQKEPWYWRMQLSVQ